MPSRSSVQTLTGFYEMLRRLERPTLRGMANGGPHLDTVTLQYFVQMIEPLERGSERLIGPFNARDELSRERFQLVELEAFPKRLGQLQPVLLGQRQQL